LTAYLVVLISQISVEPTLTPEDSDRIREYILIPLCTSNHIVISINHLLHTNSIKVIHINIVNITFDTKDPSLAFRI
jgi:hypothetical protein